MSVLCWAVGHRVADGWRSGILTADGGELVLERCERCGRGLIWRMVRRDVVWTDEEARR